MSISVRRVIGATATVGLAVVGLQLTGIGTALAHDAQVVGHATCASNGTYTVVWTITNTKTALDEVAEINDPIPSGSTVSDTQLTIAKNSSKTVTQRDIPGNATQAGISVYSLWDDGFDENNDATTPLSGTCATKTLKTATTPAARNGACVDYQVTKPAITIPKQSGITYKIGGKTVGSGTRSVAAGTYKITASSSTWTLTGRTSWTFTVTSAAGNCSPPPSAKPASPEVRQATCTGTGPSAPRLILPDTKGIDYDVSKKAPYSAGQDVKVTATVAKGYQLGTLSSGWRKIGDDRATRTVRFDEAPACSGFDDENDTNSPGAGVAAGSDVNNGGLVATGTRDFGPLAAIALAMLAAGLVLVHRTRRA